MTAWLLHTLLGVKPAQWAQGGGWRVEWMNMPKGDKLLFLLLAIACGVAGIVWLYKREGRNLTLLKRLGLSALRVAILLGALAMLLEPAIVFTKKEFDPSNLLILVDRSESMNLKDAWADPARAAKAVGALQLSGTPDLRDRSRTELAKLALTNSNPQSVIAKLGAGGDRVVRVRAFAGELLPDDEVSNFVTSATTQSSTPATLPVAALPTSKPVIDRSTTALGGAIQSALAAYRGQPLAGILVVTDGQSNSGEIPSKVAESASADGVPIVFLASGTPEGPRNAKINSIDVSPVVFVRDPSQLHVLIESRGLGGAPANVVLEKRRDGGAWEDVARQQVILEEAGRVQTVNFDFKEDRPTRVEFRARLEDVGPELTEADNVQMADVRAIRQKIKVLFIAGSSFPEMEFIRNALMRDPQVAASTWLQPADAKYINPGNPSIQRLPNTQQELDDFDCVVLYDPDPTLWAPEFSQMLTDFVGRAGGGMIYVAGERMTKSLFDQPDDPTYAWVNLLPVVAEPGLYRSDVSVRLSSMEPWRLDITAEGRADSIFAFSNKPDDNETIINNLPGMYWHFPVTRAKPGATILARHGDPRMRNEHGAHVLLATQLVGPGRTIFVGFDSTYRWRYLDEHFFDGFWARMIDRAGRSKQLGGRYPYTLSTDRTSYRPGSSVTLSARFENPSDRDAGIDSLHGELDTPGESPQAITLTPRPGEAGTFDVTFPVTKPGPHSVRVWTGAEQQPGNMRAATLQFPVELPNLEFDRPTLDRATLESLAKATGGAVYDLENAADIDKAFKTRRVARVLEDRQSIWDAPILFGSVLAALFLEWVLRKKFRMV